MIRPLPPLKHPLRSSRLALHRPLLPLLPPPPSRLSSTSTIIADDVTVTPKSEAKRKADSFYISNVLPIALGKWDPRPALAAWREETLLERLHDIGSEIAGHEFRIESWEIARKDGGVFLHYTYVPPPPDTLEIKAEEAEDLYSLNALPEATTPAPDSPGRLFLPQLLESAKKHGGFPSWAGQWWADIEGRTQSDQVPGHRVWWNNRRTGISKVGDDGEEALVKGSGTGLSLIQAAAGGGRAWVVKGRQWTEDMSRFPSNRLRVEFDGPDVSQEMLYTLFRPYGRLSDIQPPTPVPAGSLRFASLSFSRLSPATTAINVLHGYSTPTNTADFTARRAGSAGGSDAPPIPLSRLRLYYERPLKAHAIRDWISGHPRIALPVIAFLIGTLSYTFFDPIRAFFVRSKLEGVWDLEQYSLIKWVKQKLGLFNSTLGFFRTSLGGSTDEEGDSVGKNAWKDRIDAEKSVERWLSEYPSTFITITGPPGSGKASLVQRVLKQQAKPALVIDCAEIAKGKSDGQLIGALAEQTGYWPVFSFLSSLNGLIDLASVGLIGQKAGFSTPVDQQLRSMLEIVGGSLKDVSAHKQKAHKAAIEDEKECRSVQAEHERRRDLIIRGAYHDGRLDYVSGNGLITELGVGQEPVFEADLGPPPPPLMDDTAPIHGEGVPPTKGSLDRGVMPAEIPIPESSRDGDIEAEAETIRSLPIVVLKNFAQRNAKGDLWNVLSEWGASLVENQVAHVIVITEGPTATKALTRALPAKPLNTVGLSDADEANSLDYVNDKLVSNKKDSLSNDDAAQIAKLGGRMVDLETLVYKVRTGSSIKEAVDDIVRRNVVELRKQAFGDDAEDAKSLPWTRAQAWKIVSDLAKSGELPYAKLLQEFPFKGSESSLKAMEEHELISIAYYEGRADKIRPGKPVFRYAFEALVDDPVFKATCQIEYNSAVIAKAETDIRTYEAELTNLQAITANGGDAALGVEQGGFLGIGKSSAIRERARALLEKMGKTVDKQGKLEGENAEMMKLLGKA